MKPKPFIAVLLMAFTLTAVISCNPQEGEDVSRTSGYDFLDLGHPLDILNLSEADRAIITESFKRIGIHENKQGLWEMQAKNGAEIGISDDLFRFWKEVEANSNAMKPRVMRRGDGSLDDRLPVNDSVKRARRRIAERREVSRFTAVQYLANRGFTVEFNVPDSFKLIPNSNGVFRVTRHYTYEGRIKPYSYWSYFACTESADTCARVYYPTFLDRKELERFLKDGLAPARLAMLRHSELANAIDSTIASYTAKDWKRKWNKHITVHHADSVSRAYNADSVWIVDFPKDSVFFHRYTHCIGVYMSRHNRVPTLFKVLLTDSAYAHRKQWLDHVKGCVRYMDKPDTLSLERYDEASKYFLEAMKRL